MGNSAKKGHVISAGPAPSQQNALAQQAPYSGYPVQNHVIKMDATLEGRVRFSISSSPNKFQTSDMTSFFSQLASMYTMGYRLLLYISLPGALRTFGLSGGGRHQVTAQFQGIFRGNFPDEMQQQWELNVEKSILLNRMFERWSGTMFLSANQHNYGLPETYHLLQTIISIAARGGRVVCIEPSGMALHELYVKREMESDSSDMNMSPEVAVDVYWEAPRHATSERHVYQVVSCPINSYYQSSGEWRSVVEWQILLAQYHGTGWKLVDILKELQEHTVDHLPGEHMRTDCLWVFEKSESRLQDQTPVWEGSMVDNYYTRDTTITSDGTDTTVVVDCEPVLHNMGAYGWQVVRVLETPDRKAWTNLHRQFMFFQRRLAAGGMPTAPAMVSPGGTASADVSPSYSSVYR